MGGPQSQTQEAPGRSHILDSERHTLVVSIVNGELESRIVCNGGSEDCLNDPCAVCDGTGLTATLDDFGEHLDRKCINCDGLGRTPRATCRIADAYEDIGPACIETPFETRKRINGYYWNGEELYVEL